MINLKLSHITTTDEFRALRDEWNTLNDRARQGTIFSSWEWLFSWWEVYQHEGKRQLYILCCRQHGKLVGIAPFQIHYHPRRYFPCNTQLILLGTGETDGTLVLSEYLDIIAEPGLESRIMEAFSNALMAKQEMWQATKFTQLLAGSNLSRLFEGQHLSIISKETPCGFRTLIDLPDTYKDYLMSLRKKKRNNITRMYTRLQTEQTFVVDSLNDGLNPDIALTELAGLNRERFTQLKQPSPFDSANFKAFHHSLVKRLLPLNKVQIRILRIKGKAVAGLYSLIDGETMHAYQCGFESKLGHRYALLTMMLTQEISHCIDDPQFTRFNFMYSIDENSYKLRYSAYTEPMFNLSHFPRGYKAQLYQFIHGPLKQQVKSLLKKVRKTSG
ncbi:MAG: hypothetical protein CSB47_10120 [Proteobacteria bacterium]|nr:MAG: hypothetical protein CSB47_10120 [Pseudomonadota bacterium]